MANFLDDESRDNGAKRSPSHPTIESLAQIIEERDRLYRARWEAQESKFAAAFAAQEKAVDAALLAAKEAVQKAEAANEKRFESVNEFRQTLSDQTNTFMPRAEFDRAMQAMSEKLDVLRAYKDADSGRSIGLSAGWGVLVGVVGIALALASFFFRR